MKSPKAPGEDPELKRQREEAEKKAEEERLAAEKAAKEEEDAKRQGLRGRRALLSGNVTGYSLLG